MLQQLPEQGEGDMEELTQERFAEEREMFDRILEPFKGLADLLNGKDGNVDAGEIGALMSAALDRAEEVFTGNI